MSSEATTSKPEDSAKQTSEIQKEGDQTPHLSVLEEDDEFEEFAVQGEQHTTHPRHLGPAQRGLAVFERFVADA